MSRRAMKNSNHYEIWLAAKKKGQPFRCSWIAEKFGQGEQNMTGELRNQCRAGHMTRANVPLHGNGICFLYSIVLECPPPKSGCLVYPSQEKRIVDFAGFNRPHLNDWVTAPVVRL